MCECGIAATRAGTTLELSRLGPIASGDVCVCAGEAHSWKAWSSERCAPETVAVDGVDGVVPVAVDVDDCGHSRIGVNSQSGFEMPTPMWRATTTVCPGTGLAVPRSPQRGTSSGTRSDSFSLVLLSLSLSSSETSCNFSTLEANLDATSESLSCSASCAASVHACMSAATALWFLPHLSGCGGSRPKS